LTQEYGVGEIGCQRAVAPSFSVDLRLSAGLFFCVAELCGAGRIWAGGRRKRSAEEKPRRRQWRGGRRCRLVPAWYEGVLVTLTRPEVSDCRVGEGRFGRSVGYFNIGVLIVARGEAYLQRGERLGHSDRSVISKQGNEFKFGGKAVPK